MNKKYIFIFIFIFLSIILLLHINAKLEQKKFQFNGKIESIEYDVKLFATILVNDKKYIISPLKGFKENVQVGDSAIKKSGTLEFIIIKKTNGKVYNYKL